MKIFKKLILMIGLIVPLCFTTISAFPPNDDEVLENNPFFVKMIEKGNTYEFSKFYSENPFYMEIIVRPDIDHAFAKVYADKRNEGYEHHYSTSYAFTTGESLNVPFEWYSYRVESRAYHAYHAYYKNVGCGLDDIVNQEDDELNTYMRKLHTYSDHRARCYEYCRNEGKSRHYSVSYADTEIQLNWNNHEASDYRARRYEYYRDNGYANEAATQRAQADLSEYMEEREHRTVA